MDRDRVSGQGQQAVEMMLLDEGEQQQACEAVMAYFVSAFILADRPACSLSGIDPACEELLLEATGLKVAFDVESTVRMLIHLGIMRLEAQDQRAIPLEAASDQLDPTWASWFGG